MIDSEEAAHVSVGEFEGHDGQGWYYWETEYREEGCVGSFESREAALTHARESYGMPLVVEGS